MVQLSPPARRITLAPRFSISKGASSFFSGAPGQSFFSQKGLAPGPFFFSVEGASSSFFRAKPYPNPQNFSGLRPPSGAAGLVLTLNGAAGWLWGVLSFSRQNLPQTPWSERHQPSPRGLSRCATACDFCFSISQRGELGFFFRRKRGELKFFLVGKRC